MLYWPGCEFPTFVAAAITASVRALITCDWRLLAAVGATPRLAALPDRRAKRLLIVALKPLTPR